MQVHPRLLQPLGDGRRWVAQAVAQQEVVSIGAFLMREREEGHADRLENVGAGRTGEGGKGTGKGTPFVSQVVQVRPGRFFCRGFWLPYSFLVTHGQGCKRVSRIW